MPDLWNGALTPLNCYGECSSIHRICCL